VQVQLALGHSRDEALHVRVGAHGGSIAQSDHPVVSPTAPGPKRPGRTPGAPGRLRRRLDRAALDTTGAYAGLDEAGHLHGERFADALRELTDGGAATAEVNTHPGEAGEPDLDRFDWGYRWADEPAMLTAPSTRTLVERLGWRLGTFADVAAAA
jgi:hypothetical protein